MKYTAKSKKKLMQLMAWDFIFYDSQITVKPHEVNGVWFAEGSSKE
jgi:hypothetical protein